MANEKKSFLLRIDAQLWAALEKLAATELRSVNGQVEYLLREGLAKRGIAPTTGKNMPQEPTGSNRQAPEGGHE